MANFDSTPLDVRPWFRADIANVLRGLRAANAMRRDDDPREHRGFDAALYAACLSFGIEPKSIGLPQEIRDII